MTARTAAGSALPGLLLLYAGASLVHFAHNAEFLAAYPNLPASWSRAGVYLAWVGLAFVGAIGWLLRTRGRAGGFVVLASYALLGIASIGHYVVAPVSAHTTGMNLTILFEVTTALLVLAALIVEARAAH